MLLSTALSLAILTSNQVRAALHAPHTNPSQFVDQDDGEYFYQFVSRPDIGAPKWQIEVYDRQSLAPGYWFIAPYANLQQSTFPLWNGPHIYDQNGDLIWSGAPFFKHKNIHDFRVSRLNDSDVLTMNYPHDGTEGDGVILDHDYAVKRLVDLVGPNDGPNMHDFNLVDNGKHALMLTTNEVEETEVRLPWFNGTCKVHWQGFKEMDVETGTAILEWNAKGHIPLSESTYTPKSDLSFAEECQNEWDITHFNAVDKCEDGDYLLSARHTDTVYKISPNGTIVWRLGGLYSDFEFRDARARFSRQHHARCRNVNSTHTVVTVFDNAIGTGQVEEASSASSWGLHLSLRTDVEPMTADLISRYEHPSWDRSLLSQSRGSVQLLPNTNTFVGWVIQSLISEYTADGRPLMHANLRLRGTNSYRCYKFPWIGKPSAPPDVHSVAIQASAKSPALQTVVHVSWNGATEVASWHLLHTNFDGRFSELIASSPRQGFETQFRFDGFAKHVVAVAVDVEGKELGRSKIVMTDLPPNLQGPYTAWSESAWVKNAANQSLYWEVPYEQRAEGFWSGFQWFAIGMFACIAIMGLLTTCFMRRRAVLRRQPTFWWKDDSPRYVSIASSDSGAEPESLSLKDEESEYR